MIKRNLEQKLKKSLKQYPAVVLTGPRQAGKTTLAKLIADSIDKPSIYLDLEDSEDSQKLSEPKLFLQRYADKLVIIDEAQILPDLFPLLRSMIDADRQPGRFLLLGSSSPSLERQSNQSLAGRVAYHNLSPLLLSELGYDYLQKLWLNGGFPLSVLSNEDDFAVSWRKNFLRSYLGYDLNLMGYDLRIDPPILQETLELMAQYQGQALNINKISAAIGLSRPIVSKYLNILKQTFMIRMLRPYSDNQKVSMVKSPKFYIRDTGILHTLLKINDLDSLFASKEIGISWESFCIEQIIANTEDIFSHYYVRTQNKQEVDLILTKGIHQPIIMVEFKYSKAPKLEKGFYAIKEMLNPAKCFVVYPAKESYPIADDIEILSINEVHKIWQS